VGKPWEIKDIGSRVGLGRNNHSVSLRQKQNVSEENVGTESPLREQSFPFQSFGL
jgi:hypothetical protein